jgi:GT2 family glycosyltransferase/glycosyltransferase involved in cell wall biosynthesis
MILLILLVGGILAVEVDIVITVHNALPQLRIALASLEEYFDEHPFQLFLINDSSDKLTERYLNAYGASRRFANVVHLARYNRRGYTHAANHGIEMGSAEFVVLLNSDVVVTSAWIGSLIRTAVSDVNIATVSPLSNAATYQSVPSIADRSGWSKNPFSPGWNIRSMAALVRHLSTNLRPRFNFVNGFCMLFKREALRRVGLFDASRFPLGYGEENDLFLRLHLAGYYAVVDDATYVYHHKTSSFAEQERLDLSRLARSTLRNKFNDSFVDMMEAEQKVQARQLDPLRQAISAAMMNPTFFNSNTLRVLFILPTKSVGGGATSIVEDAYELHKIGVFVRVAIWKAGLSLFVSNFPDSAILFYPWDPKDSRSLDNYGRLFNVVVATAWISVTNVKTICENRPQILPAYYIQDFEPYFYAPHSPDFDKAMQSYITMSDLGGMMFAKTRWLTKRIMDHFNGGVKITTTSPSINTDACKPFLRDRSKDTVVHIVAMVRPRTPRRNAKMTMNVLWAVRSTYGALVRVTTFGCSFAERFAVLPVPDNVMAHVGILNRTQLFELFAKATLFIDLSEWQAFGRASAEAMSCGCIPVMPINGGGSEFAQHRSSTILIDSKNESAAIAAVAELITNSTLLAQLSSNVAGLVTPFAAAVEKEMLFAEAQKRRTFKSAFQIMED